VAKRRRTRRSSKQSASGWLWLLAGLGLGLCVAAGVYFSGLRPRMEAEPPPRPAPRSQTEMTAPATATGPAEEHPAKRFDFYELLPKFEVVITETERDARPDSDPIALQQPGTYVLQAGSFSTYTDADRMRAQLALLGVESRIQKVTIDEKTYHRVRIGPLNDLNELNNTRDRLRDARVEIMVIRLDGN
jgi:cell division protein FtsN